ncbi:leucyl/phenylalanyl-tRNA--protein transferase [soil metagenome]|jgi:leucyl/phenylalanyl-tRNA--protein transferase
MASRFPDPSRAPGDAPLARGEQLDPDTLIDAYAHGIFPWPVDGDVYWWSPDPRAVIPLDGVRVSRSLRRTLRSGWFRTTADTAFDAVVAGCADRPGDGARDSTWITPAMRAAYGSLHAMGMAHCVEVWDRDGGLVGGLYGVAVGGAFMGESMFHRVTDASKVALIDTARRLRAGGFTLFDAQLPTAHLTSLGAVSTSRDDYLDLLADAVSRPAEFPGGPGP